MKLSDMTTETVAYLVDPADHQNVPKAVRLLRAVISLSDLDREQLDPTRKKDHCMIKLLGTMLESLLEPFLDVSMSLSEQMTKLSTYAHLSFAMFHLHGSDFSSSQLYADGQIAIKSLHFSVCKQQLLDATQPFRIGQGGTDRLENNFSEVRCGTHQRNVDVLELSNKESSAMDRQEILNRHQDWNRGHRRLKFKDHKSEDHSNPASWIGDCTAGCCDLVTTWRTGRTRAEVALDNAQINVQFDALLRQPQLDMIRPMGDGKYPAIAVEKDRSLEEAITEQCNDDEDAGSEGDDDDIAITLGDLLPDAGDDSGSETEDKHWLTAADGYREHKASAINRRIHLRCNATKGKKSNDRLHRVRGYTQYRPKVDIASDILGDYSFGRGALAAILVRSGQQVCLAILSVSSLEEK